MSDTVLPIGSNVVVTKTKASVVAPEVVSTQTRVIKRYGNRKLYDTTGKGYVTLEDVAVAVRAGEEVLVVDAVTQRDITAQVLASAVSVVVLPTFDKTALELLLRTTASIELNG